MKDAQDHPKRPIVIQVVLADSKSIPDNAVWKEAPDAKNDLIRVVR
jgi:hypothetical protein